MTSPVLSVVIATLNEPPHILNATVASIRKTAGLYAEIILIDDLSSTPVRVDDPDVVVIHNLRRLGVGGSRHVGVEAAKAHWIILTDGHVVFTPGWLDAVMQTLPGNENFVLCGKCCALSETCNDPEHPEGEYHGAKMVIHDPAAEVRYRILTAKWAEDRPGRDFYPLSAIMGAAYSMHKSWFLRIGGLKILRGFGLDEELLSIRTIRAGGELRMLKAFRVGHIFRNKLTKPPFSITVEESLRNTIAVALTCCPELVAQDLIDGLGRSKQVTRALSMIGADLKSIERDQDDLAGVLTVSWERYLQMIKEIDS